MSFEPLSHGKLSQRLSVGQNARVGNFPYSRDQKSWRHFWALRGRAAGQQKCRCLALEDYAICRVPTSWALTLRVLFNIIEQMVGSWDEKAAMGTLWHRETVRDILGLCFTYYVMSDVCWYFFPSKSSLLFAGQYWRSLCQPTQLSGGKIPQASGWLAHRSLTPLNSNTESSVLQKFLAQELCFLLLVQVYLKGIKPSSTSLCYSEPTTNYIPIITAPPLN